MIFADMPLSLKSSDFKRINTNPLYVVWSNARARCLNRKNSHYRYYGGRGISMCCEWLASFDEFATFCLSNGWKRGLQMDRINNDGNYEPSNVRFVDVATNQRNRSNVKLNERVAREIRKRLQERTPRIVVCRQFGISKSTLCRVGANQMWHSKDQAALDASLSKEYRPLKVGERIQIGDQFLRGGRWQPCKGCIGRVFQGVPMSFPHRRRRDSLVDICGYAALAERL